MASPARSGFTAPRILGSLLVLSLGGCGSFLSQDGPNNDSVLSQASITSRTTAAPTPYALVEVGPDRIAALSLPPAQLRFAVLPASVRAGGTIGVGDAVGVTVFEAAPGGLFITDHPENPSGNSVTLPPQQVDDTGQIHVPFAGSIPVVGRTPAAVGETIRQRLSGRALEPQVMVTLLDRRSGMISVVGDVSGTAHFSLDPGGERLLGAIARAGGARFPDFETVVTLQRNGQAQEARLSEIVHDPDQNVPLAPGDTVVLSHRPDFFLAMGATGQTSSLGPLDRRIPFGDARITLADALAKAGGLEDDRAEARALFVYRLEHPAGGGGAMPTVYVTDLRDPRGYIYASRFMMHPEDLIFVSNAPAIDLVKFLDLILPAAYSAQGFNGGFR